MLVGGEEKWVLDGLPAELSEQAYMWQWEHDVDGDNNRRQEWLSSGCEPGTGEEQPYVSVPVPVRCIHSIQFPETLWHDPANAPGHVGQSATTLNGRNSAARYKATHG